MSSFMYHLNKDHCISS